MLLSLFSSGNFKLSLIFLLLRIPVVLLALSLHEAAHAWAANKLGDPTAKNLGRITVNPAKHLDPIGAVSMLLFGIGWAKPVPINSRYFKKPKRGMALSAAAGPLCNLLQAIVGGLLLVLLARLALTDPRLFAEGTSIKANFISLYSLAYLLLFNAELTVHRILGIVMMLLALYTTLNVGLALFNLIPIPPFDGSRLAFVFLPDRIYFGVMKYEFYIMIAFLVLFYFFGNWFGIAAERVSDLIILAFGWILP